MRSDLIDLTLIFLGDAPSGLAVFVQLDEDSPKVSLSLPLSVIEIERHSPKRGQCKVTLPEAFARDKV